jgi:4-aminobutyrate aminotransferase/(S)-3-amino-2-methylpropionate transaminase
MYSESKPTIAQKRNLVTAIPGPKSAELIKRRADAVSASLGTAFPVFIDRAEGAIILDVDGNSILDLGAGIAVLNVGHSANKVIENVKTQITI